MTKSLSITLVIFFSLQANAGEFFGNIRSCSDKVHSPSVEVLSSEQLEDGTLFNLQVRVYGKGRLIKRNVFNVVQEDTFERSRSSFSHDIALNVSPRMSDWEGRPDEKIIEDGAGERLPEYEDLRVVVRAGDVQVLAMDLSEWLELAGDTDGQKIEKYLSAGGKTLSIGTMTDGKIELSDNAMVGLYSYGVQEENLRDALLSNYQYKGSAIQIEVGPEAFDLETEISTNYCK